MKLAWSNSSDIKNYLSCNLTESRPYNLFMFKSYDEELLEYPWDFKETILNTWVATYSTPIIMELKDDNIQLVYKNKIKSLLYLYNHNDTFDASKIPEIRDTFLPFYEHGSKYRVNLFILFIIINREISCLCKEMLRTNLLKRLWKCFN